MKNLEHTIKDVLNRNKNEYIEIDIVELFQMVQEEYFNNFLTEETYEDYDHVFFVQCYFESLEDIFEEAAKISPKVPLKMPKGIPDSTKSLRIGQKAAEKIVGKAANDNVKRSLARKIAGKIATSVAKRVGTGVATGLVGGPVAAGIGALVGLGMAAKDAYDIYKDVMGKPKRKDEPTPAKPAIPPSRRRKEPDRRLPGDRPKPRRDVPSPAPAPAPKEKPAPAPAPAPKEKPQKKPRKRLPWWMLGLPSLNVGVGGGGTGEVHPSVVKLYHASPAAPLNAETEIKEPLIEARKNVEAVPRKKYKDRKSLEYVAKKDEDARTRQASIKV